MAKAVNNTPFVSLDKDPYSLIDSGSGSGFISGGVTGDVYFNGTDRYVNFPGSTTGTDTYISEESNVRIGDFTMTGKEFKICMKMLQKMAMKEMPEEFI